MKGFLGIVGAGGILSLILGVTSASASPASPGDACAFDQLSPTCHYAGSASGGRSAGNDNAVNVARLLDEYFSNLSFEADDITNYGGAWKTNAPSDASSDFLFTVLKNKDGTSIVYDPAQDPDRGDGSCADPVSSIANESQVGCWFKDDSGDEASESLPFAMSVKAGNGFALYVFSPTGLTELTELGRRSEGYWSSIDLDEKGLSHITFWDLAVVDGPLDPGAIPVPAPLALVGVGLGLIGLARRRR